MLLQTSVCYSGWWRSGRSSQAGHHITCKQVPATVSFTVSTCNTSLAWWTSVVTISLRPRQQYLRWEGNNKRMPPSGACITPSPPSTPSPPPQPHDGGRQRQHLLRGPTAALGCVGTWGHGWDVATACRSHTVLSLTHAGCLAFRRHLSLSEAPPTVPQVGTVTVTVATHGALICGTVVQRGGGGGGLTSWPHI
jgi:hypothetical protein